MKLKMIIKRWMERIQLFRERVRAKVEQKKINEIMSLFTVTEKYGRLWILCNGIAVREIHPEESSAEIMSNIKNLCKTALRYEYS